MHKEIIWKGRKYELQITAREIINDGNTAVLMNDPETVALVSEIEDERVVSEETAESMLDRFANLREEYEAYCRRDDGIRWSQEAEDAARDKYFDARTRLVSMLSNYNN